MQTGGAQPHIHPSDINPIEIPILTKQEQIRIAQILSDMDSEIEALENKLSKYKQLKQGLMQKLLTGAIRLTVASHVEKKVKNLVSQEKELLPKGHNWAINEAVVISVLANRFGSKEYPLGRKRYTKLSYLLHRHNEHKVIGYQKKVAGPYNPDTKYKGPEKIAIKNKYIELSKKDKYNGFVAAENITQAEDYFEKWYGQEVLQWIEHFKYEKNDTLELWATVDMAITDLEKENKQVSTQSVINLINNHKEWKPKLKRPIFSNNNIKQAIEKVTKLFS